MNLIQGQMSNEHLLNIHVVKCHSFNLQIRTDILKTTYQNTSRIISNGPILWKWLRKPHIGMDKLINNDNSTYKRIFRP